jgi:hypothetical protein
MSETAKKTRKARNPNHLANLRRNPQNLKKGGRKPQPLTYTQMEYCAKRAHGMGVSQACLELGVTPWMGRNWEQKNVLIQDLLREYREQLKINAFEKVADQVKLETEFLDRKMLFLLQKTKKLDMAVARALHTGYQRTGAIKPSAVSAMATAAAAAAVNGLTGGTMAEVYKAKWLRDKEAAMAAQLENEYRDKLLLPTETTGE